MKSFEDHRATAYTAWDASRAFCEDWINNTQIGHTFRVEAKAVLYHQGDIHDSFYLVRSGFFNTTVLREDGTCFLLEIYGPGAIFGEASAFTCAPRYVTATAVTPSLVTRYNAEDIYQISSNYPNLIVSLLRLLGIKHRLTIDKLLNYTNSTPESRVIDFLARAAMANKLQGTVQPKLTHDQIASMTALSRVTVTRALKRLAEKGLVETKGKGVEILDGDGLTSLIGIQPQQWSRS